MSRIEPSPCDHRRDGLATVLDRPMPHDIEAEQAVLGSMMLDPATIPTVAALLTPQSYYRQSHQRMHAAIVDMHAVGTPVDPVTLADELRRRDQLEDLPDQATGGLTIDYIADVVDSTPTAATAEYYARIVLRHWRRRRQILLGQRLIRAGHDPAECADEMDELRSELDELDDGGSRTRGCAVLWDDEIISRPAPRWIIEALITERGLAMLSAPEGAGKSLLALGISMSVGSGLSWLGRSVRQGPVIYVAGEGIGGLPIRVSAWRQHHGYDGRAGVLYHMGAIQIADAADVGRLIALARTLPAAPVLVVMDTLARCSVGLDESSAMDMGRVIAGCDRIVAETGAGILILHHDARGTGRARGSTAIAAGMNTILALGADGESLTLASPKQRDAAPLPPICLRLERVQLSDTESSCVVVDDHDRRSATPEPDRSLWHRIVGAMTAAASPLTLSAIAEHPDVHTARGRVRTELEAARARDEIEMETIDNPRPHGPRRIDVYRLR